MFALVCRDVPLRYVHFSSNQAEALMLVVFQVANDTETPVTLVCT